MTSAKSYAVLQSESSWGTVGSDVDRYIPLTSFGLKADTETREAKGYAGIRQQKFAERVKRTIAGEISLPLYGQFAAGTSVSFAQYVIAWAFGDEATLNRPSKTLCWFDGIANAEWDGLRVNEATLSGSPSGVSLSLSLIGKTEQETAFSPTLPNNRAKLAEFLFSDCVFTYGAAVIAMESFSLTVRHNLSLKFNSGYEPSSLRSLGSQYTFTIKPLKSNDTYAALQRLSTTPSDFGLLELHGLHDGTGASGTRTKYTASLNKMVLTSANDAVAPDDYLFQPLSFTLLKPNTSAGTISQTWSLI